MNWAEFRTSHLLKNGPSTREQLSSDYTKYKSSLLKSSPKVARSPTRSNAYSKSYNISNNLSTNKLNDSYVNINSKNTRQTSPLRTTKPITKPVTSPTKSIIKPAPLPTKSITKPVASPTKKVTLNAVPTVLPSKLSSNTVRSPPKSMTVTAPKKGTLLKMNDFDNMARNKEFFIIVLYADWCGHCRNMKSKLGNKMKNTASIQFYNENTLDESVKDHYPQVLYYEHGARRKDLSIDAVFDFLL